jgi:glycosyltransferase involved in cell wall biosynthesis
LFDEYIVVDDGSNKDDYDKNFPEGTKYIKHDTNKGLWAARNTGISNATGDIICILDDDDYFDRIGVARLKHFIRCSSADIFHFYLQEFNEGNSVYGIGAEPDNLIDYSSIPGMSWYRKKVWEELGGYKDVQAEDWNFFLRAFKNGFRFSCFPEIVVNYNRRSDSVSARWMGKKFDEIKEEVLNNI